MSGVARAHKHNRAARAAARMRRSRERRDSGCFMVARIPITDAQVLELVESGYLLAWDDQDRSKVEAAAQKAWNDLFALRVTGSGEPEV
jgi:hypothetical protein